MIRISLALIVLLGLAGVLLVVLSDGGAPGGAKVVPADATPPPPAVPGPLPAPRAEAPAPGPRPVPARPDEPLAAAGGPAAAAPGALPRDPSERVKALEPMRQQLFAGLEDLRWRIERCDVAGRTIVLALESVAGGVRIADARAEPRAAAGDAGDAGATSAPATEPGPEDEEASRCVRSALSGNVVGARDAVLGRRWEMPWTPGAPP